jgi:hypothetical protein
MPIFDSIERLLGPQRAVVIEGGDALLRRHEGGAWD